MIFYKTLILHQLNYYSKFVTKNIISFLKKQITNNGSEKKKRRGKRIVTVRKLEPTSIRLCHVYITGAFFDFSLSSPLFNVLTPFSVREQEEGNQQKKL